MKQMLRDRLRREGLVVPDAIARRTRIHLLDLLVTRIEPGGRVLVYRALPSEIDLAPLVVERPELAEQLVLPRTPERGARLTLHPWSAARERHPHGYDQPVADAEIVPDDQVVAALVPGLAFDRRGARLGRGGGYYDRLLARLGAEVLVVGVTADRLVERVPTEPHDVAMDELATSTGLIAAETTPDPEGRDDRRPDDRRPDDPGRDGPGRDLSVEPQPGSTGRPSRIQPDR